MEKEKKSVQNHGAYSVLEVGAVVLTINTSDITTDANPCVVDLTPKNMKEPVKFVSRGRNNDLPFDIIRSSMKNVTVSSNLGFKTNLSFGEGIQVLRRVRNAQSGKIEVREVLPSEEPEVFAWLELNDPDFFLQETINDLTVFGDSYVEYIFSRDKSTTKVAQIKSLETACSRISQINEKTGRIEYHGYCDDWVQNRGEVIATPLLDRAYPMYDLLQRMGMEPNGNGKKERVSDRRFVQQLRVSTPGRFYYAKPYWWSVFFSGWFDFSSSIIDFKKNLIKNEMYIKYIIYVKDGFYDKLYEYKKAVTEAEMNAVKTEFLTNLNNYLTGSENAGNSFVSQFSYDKIKGYEDKDIIIERLEKEAKGGDYIEDSEESSNMLCYGMGVHSSILGNSPGKSKSINGTEARELFTIQQSLSKYIQRLAVKPYYMVKKMNGWPSDLEFAISNLQLTTLDKGTGAIKQTGIKPETNE